MVQLKQHPENANHIALQRFNSKMVQLKHVGLHLTKHFAQGFNSKMVQLKHVGLHLTTHFAQGFNSKMVQLKLRAAVWVSYGVHLFQFQNGTIKAIMFMQICFA